MSSRFSAGAAAFAIILAAGHASAAAQDQKPSAKPQKVSGTAKSAAQIPFAPLGATVDSVLVAGRQLNPALRAAALETSAAAAKAAGADALDDPMISDSYQYYRNPNVFSGHAIMMTQGVVTLLKFECRFVGFHS